MTELRRTPQQPAAAPRLLVVPTLAILLASTVSLLLAAAPTPALSFAATSPLFRRTGRAPSGRGIGGEEKCWRGGGPSRWQRFRSRGSSAFGSSSPLYSSTKTEAETTAAAAKGSDGGGAAGANGANGSANGAAGGDGGSVPLSDVDARVLRSILEEQKLDLQTEDSVKRLLERGTKPPPPPPKSGKKDDEDEKYASTVLKAFSNNAFWNSLRAKTEEVLDSAKIFLANRIERDAKLLASVGLFALERAKRDVGRALPESGRTGAAVGRAMRTAVRQLAANSSFAAYVPEDNFILPPSKYGENAQAQSSVFDELNTPLDEIRSVTESIRDILSGKVAGDGGSAASGGAKRGLRSVAPAGTSQAAERQRRAYQRRRETVLAREKEGIDKKFGRTVGTVADAAAEVRREFEVEGNRAGYRSEAAVRAIEAGAAAALLEAGQAGEGWGQLPLGMGQRLFGGAKRRGEERDPIRVELKEAAVVVPVLTMEDLLEERARFAASLRACLETPDQTWLMPGVVAEKMENNTFDDQALKDVITTMICARDDNEIFVADIDDTTSTAEEDLSMSGIIAELKRMKGTAETIISLAAVAAGYDAAERLKAELIGQPAADADDFSLLAALDDIVRDYEAALLQREAAEAAAAASADAMEAAAAKGAQRIDFTVPGDFSSAANDVPSAKKAEVVDTVVDAVILGAEPSPFFADADGDASTLVSDDEMDDVVFSSATVELVTDEELSDDFFDAKAVAAVSEKDELDRKDEQPPFVITVLLRSLDVALFIAEKTFFVGVPVLFRSAKNVAKRLNKEQRNGLGSEGWEMLENVQDGAKRY